jgi:hypothetical protein
MTIFESLFVAHLVADWLLQTEWQALNKHKNFRALFTHIGIYSLVIWGVLVAYYGFRNVTVYLVVGVVSFVHIFLDRRLVVEWYLKTFRLVVDREPPFFLMLAADQIFHILILAVGVLILSISNLR